MAHGPDVVDAVISAEIKREADRMEKIINADINEGKTVIYTDQFISSAVDAELRRRYIQAGWSDMTFSWGEDYDTLGTIRLVR